jgi:CSLREA domain-containing protein
MRSLFLRLISVALALTIAGAVDLQPTRAAGPFVINSLLDEQDASPGDGQCATTGGVCTLRAAVQEANALAGADSITLPAGTYLLTFSSSGEEVEDDYGDLDLTESVTIAGAGSAVTIIDGNGAQMQDRVFDVQSSSASVTLSGLTIRNGQTYPVGRAYGGGIYNEGSALSLNDVVIANNSAYTGGGGLYSDGGSVSLTNSTIRNNTTGFGGGIYFSAARPASLTLTDSSILDNTAQSTGGGIYNDGSVTTLIRSTVARNSAGFAGGGIFNSTGSFSDAPNSLTLINSTISTNTAASQTGPDTGRGGGVFNDPNGVVDSVNSTIVGNSAKVAGGNLFNGQNGSLRLTNTIVAASGAGANCVGTITSGGHNLASDTSCGLSAAGDLLAADPRLGPLANNGGPTLTHAVLSGSPAIDAGLSSVCPATDQRGLVRNAAVCDIGAFEVLPPPTVNAQAYLPLAVR